MKAVALAASDGFLYALREDGVMFVFIRRGTMSPATGKAAVDPHWCACPAVPGTEGQKEQAG